MSRKIDTQNKGELHFCSASIDGGKASLWVNRDRVEPAAGPAMSAMPRKRQR